jgi:hypothetical protein
MEAGSDTQAFTPKRGIQVGIHGGGEMASIDKSNLRDALLKIEVASVQEASLLYESHLQGAKPDLSEADDQGQRSQNEQSGIEAQRFEEQSHLHESHKKAIQAIDFGPKQFVQNGALVRVNGRYFVIAVPTRSFYVEGVEVLGISVDAPLFAAMEGLRSGDTFEFKGNSFMVEDVQ